METMNRSTPGGSIAQHFGSLQDPRVVGRCAHDLLDVLTITFLAVICGADGWDAIEDWARFRESWLRTFLRLPHGIPGDDTYRRVFAALRPAAFAECFTRWATALVGATAGKLVALDGQTLRHSFDRARGQSALHLVHAWVADNGVVLGQIATDAKSNEITAIPALLELLDLRGAVVTIDAMGCQKEIAAAIVEAEADYVLALKDNHPTARDEVARYFEHAAGTPAVQSVETTDGDHGRIEIRRTHLTTDVAWFEDRGDWAGLRSFVWVETERHVGTTVTREQHYFLSSLATTNAAQMGSYVRGHWGIENKLHWSLDVTFHQDASRIRRDHAPQNFAAVRKLALVPLKAETTFKAGIERKRRRADRDLDYLLAVLNAGGRSF